MDARFAGSARVADRRRRRLAVEHDQPPLEAPEAAPLPAEAGLQRTAHRPAAPAFPEVLLPLSRLVPTAWWKYVAGGTLGWMGVALLVFAAWKAPGWVVVTGPALGRLIALPEPRVANWASGLMLSLCGQLALLIWWGRSRSLKDFDGRYRLWTRTACVWMLMGFCASTGAHQSLAEAGLRFVPREIPRGTLLAWLVPAVLVGLVLLAALNRELAGCRTSRALLLVSSVLYAVVAGLRVWAEGRVVPHVMEIAGLAATLLAHLHLLMCMWTHARHVLHCSAEPSRVMRRRIPRPHFRLSLLGLFRRKPAGDAAEPADVDAPRVRKRRGRKTEAPPAATAEEETAPAEKAPPATSRRLGSMLRLDSRHPAPRDGRQAAPEESAISGEANDSNVENESLANDRRPSIEPVSLAEISSREERDRDDSPEEHAREHSSNDMNDESEGDWAEELPRPDMRGLSKKQRRRLMQELREKERAQRRNR